MNLHDHHETMLYSTVIHENKGPNWYDVALARTPMQVLSFICKFIKPTFSTQLA